VINHPGELSAQGFRGKHTFSCALPTRGGSCDCHPEDLSAAVKRPTSPVATPAIVSSIPQATSATEAWSWATDRWRERIHSSEQFELTEVRPP
jgi:hypothetical protein